MKRRGIAGYGALGICLAFLGALGGAYSVPTLGPALYITAAGLAFTCFHRRTTRLHLIDLWIFAFIYLFLSDLVLSEDQVLWLFGTSITTAAEAFIVGSFGTSLVGYWAIERHGMAMRASRPGVGAAATVRAPGRPRARRLPLALALLGTGLSAVVIGYVWFVVTPEELFSTARLQRTFVPGTVRILFVSGVVMQPIITTYLAYRYNARNPMMLLFFVIAALSAVALYASGTRFYLGFMLCGVLFYVLQPMRPMSGRRAMALLLAAVLCMALQGMMRMSRRAGLMDAALSTLGAGLWEPESYLSSEGLLRVNAWVHAKRAWEMPSRSYENLFILYWWVPRTVWANKPTMEGHWLIQDVMDEGYYDAQHSVAGGFAMPALLDFGPIAGAFVCTLYGAWIAWIERLCRRHADIADPASALVGLCTFGVFFMMRGLHLSLIFMILCCFWYLPFHLLQTWGTRRRPMRLPRQLISGRPARAIT